jgi:hypothetical protein
VGREPIEAFRTEAEYLVLAERLSGRVGRPALSEGLVKLQRELAEWWERTGATDTDAKDSVVEVRLVIVSGDRLSPRDAYVLVITSNQPMADVGRRAWHEWWERATELVAADGLNLMDTVHETLDSLTARHFRAAIPLQLSRWSSPESPVNAAT